MGASLSDRALVRDGAVTMDNNAVSCGSCDGIDEITGPISPPVAPKGSTDEFGITLTGLLSEGRSQRVIANGNILSR
jgi:hypothetical protein